MSSRVRFSIGIPTLNQASFLGRAIESLLAQKRLPDEIVISDHGSTDGTAEIVAEYTARYPGLVHGVRPPAGSNLTDQYNFTLASQSGDWITLLSSDDLAMPNFCETMLHGAERCDDAVLVRAGWNDIDGDNKVLSPNYLLSVAEVERTPINLISQRHGPKASFAAFAIKREAFEAAGPIFTEIESLADWALFVQLAPFGAYVSERELVSGYRVGHDGNKFRDRIGMWLRDERRMFERVIPLAAERAGVQDRAWIGEASRINFERYIVGASRAFLPNERAELMADFAPWAESVGGGAMLQRFANGETLRETFQLGRVTRRWLRPIAQRVVHWRRGR